MDIQLHITPLTFSTHTHYDNHGMNIALELFEAAVQELANEYHNKCHAMYGKYFRMLSNDSELKKHANTNKCTQHNKNNELKTHSDTHIQQETSKDHFLDCMK